MTGRFVVALVAMAILFVLLLAASVRLVSSDSQLNSHVPDDMVWLTSQSQYESVRLSNVLASYALGTATLDDVRLAYDLLVSRIVVLEEGEPHRQMVTLGHEADLLGYRAVLDEAKLRIDALTPDNAGAIAELRAQAMELASTLRLAANTAVLAKRDRDSYLFEQRRHTLFEVLGTLVATMIAGLLLAAILVRDHRNMVSTESALERERQVSRLHRAFISIVSHQFRTPLAIIDASAQRMIRRGAQMTGDEIASRAEKIRAACLRLTRLMESTLNAARLEEGEISLNLRSCDIKELLRNVIDSQPDQDQRRIELKMEGLPSWVDADVTLLEQAVQNLVSNALKYSPNGEPVTIEARRIGSDISVSVIDRGVGVPADEVNSLFRRFFRARTAEGIPGTGIGLSFVAQIMDLHGGSVGVQSAEGQGSTFTLRFPCRRTEHDMPLSSTLKPEVVARS
jgi:two-component system, OmpR family, sensor histidine kinase SenX3